MPIILASFLGLFLELAFIRWVPANVFALAYFSNTVLIAAFLGLGIGMLLASKKWDAFSWFPLILGVSVGVLTLFRFVFVYMVPSSQELLWNFHYVDNWMRPLVGYIGMLPTLAIAFVASAAPFVPIGQKVARSMEGIPSLKAYNFDVVGSLLGIAAFALLSSIGGVWGSPFVWFLVAGLIAAWLLRHQRIPLIGMVVCTSLLLGMIQFLPDRENWSPYYAINILKEPDTRESRIFVNRFLHQVIMDFERNEYARQKYAYPYTLVSPKKVLVLGAGSGNDVAIAAMNGAEEITAVELDPLIAQTGKLLHPNRPYQDPRVTLHIGDARAFLRQTKETYDLIVFATLDSHALLSGMSTVRVENFVYTKEAFEDARDRLAPDGVAVVMYSAPQQWLGDKIIRLALDVFGGPNTLVYAGDETFLYNLMIIGGPGTAAIAPNHALPEGFVKIAGSTVDPKTLPTDDWPYLYLRSHSIPLHYVQAIAILFALAVAGIWIASGKRLFADHRWQNGGFFALGAAFLLLETKSVTSLSLLFGTSWWVNASVFGGILIMILAANTYMARRPVARIEPWYVGLLGSLILGFVLSPTVFIGAPLIAALFAALPMLFAAVIFAFHIRSVRDMGSALGVNIMGAVCGGFLEYVSMATGLRFLYVLAALLYLAAFLAFRKSANTPSV